MKFYAKYVKRRRSGYGSAFVGPVDVYLIFIPLNLWEKKPIFRTDFDCTWFFGGQFN